MATFTPEHLKIAAKLRKRGKWRWRAEQLALLVVLLATISVVLLVGWVLGATTLWMVGVFPIH